MRKLPLVVIAVIAAAAYAIPTSSAFADTFVARCPDHYEPVPTMAAPPDQQSKDHNMNLFVCAKGPQGSNGHFNVKDDQGMTVSPTVWDVDPVTYTVFTIEYALDAWRTYTLDPTPVDVVDDL